MWNTPVPCRTDTKAVPTDCHSQLCAALQNASPAVQSHSVSAKVPDSRLKVPVPPDRSPGWNSHTGTVFPETSIFRRWTGCIPPTDTAEAMPLSSGSCHSGRSAPPALRSAWYTGDLCGSVSSDTDNMPTVLHRWLFVLPACPLHDLRSNLLRYNVPP